MTDKVDIFPNHDTLVVNWEGDEEAEAFTTNTLESIENIKTAWYRPDQRSFFLLLRKGTSETVRDKIAELGLDVDDTF